MGFRSDSPFLRHGEKLPPRSPEKTTAVLHTSPSRKEFFGRPGKTAYGHLKKRPRSYTISTTVLYNFVHGLIQFRPRSYTSTDWTIHPGDRKSILRRFVAITATYRTFPGNNGQIVALELGRIAAHDALPLALRHLMAGWHDVRAAKRLQARKTRGPAHLVPGAS